MRLAEEVVVSYGCTWNHCFVDIIVSENLGFKQNHVPQVVDLVFFQVVCWKGNAHILQVEFSSECSSAGALSSLHCRLRAADTAAIIVTHVFLDHFIVLYYVHFSFDLF